jgi:ABC-type sugar transport system substrate-binding protein
METGFTCTQRLLNLPDLPTAIFAANGRSAFGVLRAAQEAGLRVPDDLSVVGFDNIPEAAYINPSLTTVDQFIDKMGHVATEMLIDLMQGNSVDSSLYEMPTQLIVRDSCRAIASNTPSCQTTACGATVPLHHGGHPLHPRPHVLWVYIAEHLLHPPVAQQCRLAITVSGCGWV